MRIADADDALFSLKCFAAAMLAFYVALRIGLTRPYWAVTTSYIVAQPFAGAVLSKALFRLVGTIVGAAAAVVLVPSFVNEPMVLSLALGLWLGLCLYVAQLDRTPRAYVFLLAGYTASIIGFPSVNAPGAIFQTAILRVQEIGIGILSGSIVHGLVFPRTVTARLLERVDEILRDAERWTRDALLQTSQPEHEGDRLRLALDINELHQLSVHLPFDTARFLPRVRTVRALQDQLSFLLPLAATIEDRLQELDRVDGRGADVTDRVSRVAAWIASRADGEAWRAQASALIQDIAALEPPAEAALDWNGMLRLNLASRLAELVAVHRDVRSLRDQLRAPTARPITSRVGELVAQAGGRALHRDRGLALRSAAGTIATILLGSAFWIATGWADGAGAVLIAGVCCALFGSAERPGRAILTFLGGTALGLGLAMIYAYAILPRATSFAEVAASTAPTLLVLGSMLAKPRWTALAVGTLLGFCNTVGFDAAYEANFLGFVNGGIAQLTGTAFAVVTVALFQTLGTEEAAQRLIRAGWLDVARRAEGAAGNRVRWAGRMLDRIGLLSARLAGAGRAGAGAPLAAAMADLRTGIVAGDLRALAGREDGPVDQALAALGRFYRNRSPNMAAAPDLRLLALIDSSADEALRSASTSEGRERLVLLTSLRRSLFPDAPPYARQGA